MGDPDINPPSRRGTPIIPDELPPLEDRLADLRPSRELLEFYRQKIAEFDDEYSALLKRFESQNAAQEERIKTEEELRQREAEVHQLQKALSDVQVFLMQERENVVRLYSENDRLKLQQFEDSKKIQALLALMGGKASVGGSGEEVTYFHREPPAKAVVERIGTDPNSARPETEPKVLGQSHLDPNRISSKAKPRSARSDNKHRCQLEEIESQTESEVALLKIKALQAQLEDVTRTSREEIDILVEDRRVAREETEARVKGVEARMEEMTKKHKRIQDMLQQTTQDLLNEKQSHRASERAWMSEKDRLLRELDEARECLTEDEDEVAEEQPQNVQVIDVGGGGDGPHIVGCLGNSQFTQAPVSHAGVDSDATIAKQTADHSAQTLIPSLGTLPPRPITRPRRIVSKSSLRNVRIADAMMERKERQHQLEIEALQKQLIQANKLAEMYREQVIGVESELSRLREEDSLNRTIYKERSDNMGKRLGQMKERYAALEKRRLLEAEGFKTDIRLLRNRLKEAERQIYKLTISMPVSEGDDMAMLKEVKVGAARAKKAQGEVNLLKAKIYGIEHQLKKL